jgi:hypothetical protein
VPHRESELLTRKLDIAVRVGLVLVVVAIVYAAYGVVGRAG